MGYNSSKLSNFARGKRIGFWLITVLSPVQLIRSASALLSSDKERCEMPSHKQLQINLDWIQNQTNSLWHFTVTSRVIKIQFGILSPPWSICYFILIFSCREQLLHHLVQKPIAKFVQKWNLKPVWQKFIWDKTIIKHQNCFFNAGWCSCFWREFFLLTIAFEKFLRSKGNLFKKSLQKVVRRNVVQIFPNFPAKRLWKRETFSFARFNLI